jgi:alpha-D-ribose 1-methylphosphonate 5-phosphate C-P lyase
VLAIIALVIGGGALAFREQIDGYGSIASAYSARVACSCRYVAGRPIEDCAKDKLAGMEAVTLVEDVETKSVTARFPLVASATATYREGYGCVLEPYAG